MNISIASTGSVIKMYLSENMISAYDLSRESHISLRTIVRVLNDERPLDFELARCINKFIPEISVEFLMVYDTKYQILKKTIAKENDLDVSKVISVYQMKKLYKESSNNEIELFNRATQIFGVENIRNNFKIDLSELSFCFSLAKGEKGNNHLIWLKTAYEERKQSGDKLLKFNEEKFNDLFLRLKEKIYTADIESARYNMKSFCEKCGINFYYRPSIPGARVKAVSIKDKDGYLYIFISDLFKCVENLWLSFIHECIHIKNDDFDKKDKMKENAISILIDENYIDEEVINFLLNTYSANDFQDLNSIINLANRSNVSINVCMEMARFKTKCYTNKQINKYIHYFK